MNKNKIRLTESDLHRIVKESVKSVLKENAYNDDGVWEALDYLKQFLSAEDIIARILSRLGSFQSKKILDDIIAVECPQDEE